MADLAKIKRNVGRMVDQNAPEADIDEYIRGEGVTLDDVRAFKPATGKRQIDPEITATAERRLSDPSAKFDNYLQGRVADMISFGAATPVSSALTAAGKTAYKALSGQEPDFTGDYSRERDTQDEMLRISRERAGIGGTAAEWMLSAGASGGTSVAQPVAQAAKGALKRWIIDPAIQGGKFGAIYGVNSARGDLGEQIEHTADSALGGALFGPIIHGGVNALARVPVVGARAVNYLTGRTPEKIAAAETRAADMAAEGIRPYGPAITDSSTQRATAESLAGSVFGAPLRREAQGAVSDATAAVQRGVREPIGYQAVNDIGAEIQGGLRRNLTEHSIPSNALDKMSREERSRITGPVDSVGFSPPPPKVEPVQPRRVDPVQPEPVDHNTVPFDIARPSAVQRYEANPRKINRDEIPQSPEHVQAVDKAERAVGPAKANLDVARAEFDRIAEAKGMKPEDMYRQLSVPANYRGMHGEDALAAFNKLNQAHDVWEPLFKASIEARGNMAKDQRARWLSEIEREHARASAEAEGQYIRDSSAATREANERTQENRKRAISQAEADARSKAQVETARLQKEADDEALRATQKAQFEAEQAYQKNRPPSSEFEAGRSRESYPTEFSAAYKTLDKMTPSFGRNPVGEHPKMILKGVSNKPTATEGLLHEFALDMRKMGNLPGYKGSSVYGDAGIAPHPKFMMQLKSLLGDDVAQQIDTLMVRRAKGYPGMSPSAMRDFITMVREAKQQARKAASGYPAVPMKADAAALARLEGSLKQDFDRFVMDTGPNGQRLVEMRRNLDAKYAEYINDMRRPLSKVFGDKVEPMQAMDRLASATKEGDLSLIRPYMRVAAEKGDTAKAVAAIVAHMTNNGADLSTFLRGYRSIGRDVRMEFAKHEDARKLLNGYDRLERIAERLAPFEKAIQGGGGIDLSSKTNWAIGLTALAHVTTTLFASAGAAAASKLLASPRYVEWMQRTMTARTSHVVNRNLERFAFMVSKDSSLPGDVKESIKSALDMRAQADDAQRRYSPRDEAPPHGDTWQQTMQTSGRGTPLDRASDISPEVEAAYDRIFDAARRSNPDVTGHAEGAYGHWTTEPDARMGDLETMLMAAHRSDRSETMRKAIETVSRASGVRPPWQRVPRRTQAAF